MQQIGEHLESVLRDIPGTRNVLAERTAGGSYLDFDLRREDLARYGLTVADAQAIVAVGDRRRERHDRDRRPRAPSGERPLRARLPRRHRLADAAVLVPTPSGAQIPMAQIADLRFVEGPSMIRKRGTASSRATSTWTWRDATSARGSPRRSRRVAEDPAAEGLPPVLERAVREHDACASGSPSCCR